MKILAFVHGYPPTLNAGAEAMLHQILIDLKNRGHQVGVITNNPSVRYYEGVRLYEHSSYVYKKIIEKYDIIITHLELTSTAVNIAKRYNKKIVHLVHNDYSLVHHGILNEDSADLIVANSQWIKDKVITEGVERVVVNPPTKLDRYKTHTSKKFVTLINLCYEKGGELFWDLAKAMPDVQFLGVKGGHSTQIVKKGFDNVTILENSENIKPVYAKTKILLVPSHYESWGRVGIEAACSGIPVIAARTPGLKESLGDAAIFLDPHDLDAWSKAIRSLDNQRLYNKYSAATQHRAEKLSAIFDSQMDELEAKLVSLLSNN